MNKKKRLPPKLGEEVHSSFDYAIARIMETGEFFRSKQFPDRSWFTAKIVKTEIPDRPHQILIHVRYNLPDGTKFDFDVYVEPKAYVKMSRKVEEQLRRFNIPIEKRTEYIPFEVRYFYEDQVAYQTVIMARRERDIVTWRREEDEKRKEQALGMMDIAIKRLDEEKPSYSVEKIKNGDIVTILSAEVDERREVRTNIYSGIVLRVGESERNGRYVLIGKELIYHRFPNGRQVPEKIGEFDIVPVKHIRYVSYHGDGQGTIIPSSEFVEKGQRAIDRYWDEWQIIARVRSKYRLLWVPGQVLRDKQGNLCDDLEAGNVIKISLLDLEAVFNLINTELIWEVIAKEKGQSKLLDIVSAFTSLHQEWIYQDRQDAVGAINRLAKARKEMERFQRDLLKKVKEEAEKA